MSLYTGIKVIHVFLAIVAVGFNMTYGIWVARAAREPEHELHVLKGIKNLDDRFANPAYVLLLVTGVAMVLVAGIPFTTFWIAAALVLYVVIAVLGLAFYTPTLRRQIEALETGGRESPEYQKLAKKATGVGITTALVVVLIVVLMVVKPTLS